MLRGNPHESDIGSSDISAHVTRIPLSVDNASHRVTIPDTELLFSAKFTRAGSDLILTGEDGHKIVLSGYFDQPRHADLVAPGGAILTADVVAKLTLSQTPGQYAQAGAPAGAVAIGKVERLGGSATVQHANGTVEELHVGDNVYQGDVVETQGGSLLGMSFLDGTAFNMGAAARMVLSELTYDANSNSNSGVFSLVKGTITFVAGKVAKTGDMRVETPVATMGIRGTSVNTNITTDVGGNTVSVTYSLMPDPDGHIGSFNILDRVTGAIIGTITTTDTTFVVTPTANLGVLAAQLNKTPEQIAQELAVAQVLFPIFLANPANFNNQNVNPQNGHPGSGTPPGGSTPGTNGGLGGPGNGNNGNPTRTDGGQNGTGTGGNFTVDLPHVNQAPSVFADVPTHLVEAVSGGSQGAATALSHITKVDLDGTVGYNTFAMAGDGWIHFGNGIFSKLGTYGAASLNASGASVASLVADGWTDVGNGFLEKTVSFGASGNATIRISTSIDTVTYALDNNKADPLRQIDHPTETFTIPVIDDSNATATTTVVFTVDGRNDPPSVVTGSTNATGGVTEDSSPTTLTAAGTITFKDAELTDTHTLTGTPTVPSSVTVTDGNGNSEPLPGFNPASDFLGTLTLTVVENPNDASDVGTVQWSFSVNDNDPRVQALAVGQVITQIYTVTIDDGQGGSVQQQITVTITGSNDDPDNSAPVIVTGSVITGAFDELTSPAPSTGLTATDSVGGTIKFVDIDLIDAHTAAKTFVSAEWTKVGGATASISDPGGLTLSAVHEILTDTDNQASVDWTYSAVDANLDFLAAGETLVVTYNIKIQDNTGSFVVQPVTVTITGTNDVPDISGSAITAGVTETNTTLTATGTLNVSDADMSDTVAMAVDSVTVDASSTFAAINPLSNGALKAMMTVTFGALAADPSGGSNFNWTFTSGSVGDGAFNFLAVGETLVLNYTLKATDSSGVPGTDTQVVTITVTGTNDAPDITGSAISATLTETDTVLNATGTLNVVDLDLTNTVTLSVDSVSIDSSSTFAEANPLSIPLLKAMMAVTTGPFVADPSGGSNLTWTFTSGGAGETAFNFLAAGETLVLNYTLKATDSSGVPGTDTQVVTITITGTNDVPSINGPAIVGAVSEANAAITVSDTLSIYDADISNTVGIAVDSVAVLNTGSFNTALLPLTNGDLKAMMAVSPTTVSGEAVGSDFTWTFTSGASGNGAFNFLANGETLVLQYTLKATDSSGTPGTDTRLVTVTITGTNDAPFISVAGNDTDTGAVREDDHAVNETATGTLSFADLDLTDTHSVTGITHGAGILGALTASVAPDSTGAGSGGVITWNYSVPDSAIQYLAAGETKTETFTISLYDGTSTVTKDVTVTITGTNDAPVMDLDTTVPSLGATLAYTENDAATAIAPQAAVTDIDSTDFNGGSLTVSFTANGTSSDQLTILTDGAVTVSGSDVSVDGVVVGTINAIGSGLNGAPLQIDFNSASATPAAVSKLMQHIGFANSSDDPSALPRSVEFKVVDGDGVTGNGHDVSQLTATVNVTPVNDAPVFTGTAAGTAFLERGAAVMVAASVLASDVDSTNYDQGSLTVAITAGAHTGDKLSVANSPFINVDTGGNVMFDSDGAGTDFGLVTIGHVNGSGSSLTINLNTAATDAAVMTLTRSIQFSNDSSHDPTADTRTVTFTLADGGGTANSGQDTASFNATVDVTPVNDAPAFTGNSAGAVYLEQGSAVLVAAGVSAADIDSVNYDGGSLKATVTAGGHQGDTLSILNDDFITVDSGGNVMFDSDGAGTNAGFVQIGTLTDGINSLMIDLNSDATDAAVVALAQAIQFSNATSDDPSTDARTVTFTLKDGGGISNNGQDSTFFNTTVNVAPINDAPAFTGSSVGTDYVENGAAVSVATNVSATDVDSANYDQGSLTATVTAGTHAGDALSIANNDYIAVDSGGNVMFDSDGAGVDFSPVIIGSLTDNGTSLTIDLNSDATDAAVKALAEAVQFSTTSDDPTAAARTVTFALKDGGGIGNDGQDTASFDATVNVTPVNDAPVLTGVSGSLPYTELASPVAVATSVSTSDVDSTSYDQGSLTAAITAGSHSGDALSIANNDFITVDTGDNVMFDSDGAGVDFSAVVIGSLTDNGTSLTIDLNGDATAAAVKALVEAIQFSSTSHDPTSDPRTVAFTLIDGGGQANGGSDTTSFNAFVAVTPVNEAPVSDESSSAGNEDANSIGVSLTGSDLDGSVASFQIGSVPNASEGTLYADAALTDPLQVGETVTATNNMAQIYFVPAANFNGNAAFQYFAIDNDGLADSTPANCLIQVAASNDAPIVSGLSASGDAPSALAIDGAISFTDVDASDTHTSSFVPNGSGYVGDFTVDPVTEPSGPTPGSVGWHLAMTSGDYASITASVTQAYDVTISDGHAGGDVTQTVSVTIGTVDADMLDGTSGANVLVGGAGEDTFSFVGPQFGAVIVADFTPNSVTSAHDVIQLSASVANGDFTTLMDTLAHEANGSTIIDVGGGTITLTNILKQSLSASDFHFGGFG